jgi:hypothetical protein
MNAKALLGIVFGIIAAIVFAYFAFPSAGQKALKREQHAVELVSSWRITMQISRNGLMGISRIHVARCPDQEHILEEGGDDYAEYIRLGDDVYYRKNSSRWIKGTPGPDLFLPMPTPRPCLSNPGEPSSKVPGGAEEFRLALQTEIKEAHIEKAAAGGDSTGPCQEWTIQRITENSKMSQYTVCIGSTDDLPHYMRGTNENINTYFEWDPTPSVVVEAPDINNPNAPWPRKI